MAFAKPGKAIPSLLFRKVRILRHCRLFVTTLVLIALSACVTPTSEKFGVEDSYLAHIPARIAVLPCRLWPQGALFPTQRATTLAAENVANLCAQFDATILQGFVGQPFMRGLSPRVVQALLEKNSQPQHLAGLDNLWFRPGQACESCRHPATYYKEVIAPRTDWRAWLTTLSRASTNSDAVLLPFILSTGEEHADDRGLFYAQRSASIALLLIDSNNGQLIWSGGREAEVRLPAQKSGDQAIVYPPWEELWKRVFTDDIWLAFPGRQT